MLTLIVTLCLAQGEAPVVSPPPATVAPAAVDAPVPPEAPRLEAIPASPDEPPEVALATQFIGKHLLSVDMGLTGLKVRSAERSWGLGDSPSAAFSLVPEAMHLAESAERDYAVARVLETTSLAITGAALIATLTTVLLAPAIALVVSLISLATMGVALVLAIIAVPYSIAAQEHFLQAIELHNRGLLNLRPVRALSVTDGPGGLRLSLP